MEEDMSGRNSIGAVRTPWQGSTLFQKELQLVFNIGHSDHVLYLSVYCRYMDRIMSNGHNPLCGIG